VTHGAPVEAPEIAAMRDRFEALMDPRRKS
jgi:hypothetical protein